MLGWSGKAQTDFLPILLLSINILACVLEHNPRQMWEEDFTHMVINFENLFHWDVWFIFTYSLFSYSFIQLFFSVACKHLNNWRNWEIYTAYKSTYFIKCSWSSEAMNTQVLIGDPFSLLHGESTGQCVPTNTPLTAFPAASVSHRVGWILCAKAGTF